MLPEQLKIQDDFPPVTYEQWRDVAVADLEGAPFEKLVTPSYEGIDIQPIYTRADAPTNGDPHGLPGFTPYVRGASLLGSVKSGCDLRQEHAHPDLVSANKAVLTDLAGGVTSVELRTAPASRNGHDPDEVATDSANGLLAFSTADLDTVLADVPLKMIGVALDAGAAFLPTSAHLIALWHRRGVSSDEARGAFNADPLCVLATEGTLPYSIESGLKQMVDLAAYASRQFPNVTAIGVSTAPYHKAGATAAQDIAFGAATAIEYLRATSAAGLAVDDAARQMLFGMHIGTHHFLAIAKLRAARRVWARVVEACGGSPQAGAMRIHARTSDRVLTHRDAHVNLLRNTVAVFAASLGGADVITSVPFDCLFGLPTDQSRRIARNTVLILQEEAHLNRVVDPAGGSWFLDKLTDQLAVHAWRDLQQVEQQGGMLAALRSGWIADRIAAAYAPRAKDIAARTNGITGVSEFPNVAEAPFQTTSPDHESLRKRANERVAFARQAEYQVDADDLLSLVKAAAGGASVGQLAKALGFHQTWEKVAPMETRSFAEPFEQLRDASDVWLAQHGVRPRVFLANLGPVAHFMARASYAKNFFEAGGFEVIEHDGYDTVDQASSALQESGARIAVICSSDTLYSTFVPEATAKLKGAGARTVVLTGFPGDNEAAWRAAGVDRFIYIKCDAVTMLREMLSEEGVLAS
jgi:methylmalonyl-CoA mutase